MLTYVSRDGSAINENTINGDEFTLTGTGLADIKLVANTGGRPDVVGQPLQVGSNTYRYFFRDKDRNNTIDLFQAGEVQVNFKAGSFTTVDGGQAVARVEQFTIDPAAAGEKAGTKPIKLGPLTLQGPSIGIADIGFSDGFLMLTIAIGVDRASLAFGGGGQETGQAGQPPTTSEQQQSSGITADLIGVLGTFDIGVDVFGLLSGNVRINIPGRFSFSVQSLEVEVPNVVKISAEGIKIQFEPAPEVPVAPEPAPDPGPDPGEVSEEVREAYDEALEAFQNFPQALEAHQEALEAYPAARDAWLNQEILVVDTVEVLFPKFEIRGRIEPFITDAGEEIPGLVIRPNGFRIGTAELCFGCEDPALNTASSTNPEADIKIGSILELDDIRIGVRNFEVIFGQGLDFDGSIFVASGGAKLFPGSSIFSATVMDRNAANDVRPDGTPDDEAIRLELKFENGRVKGFEFEVDTLEIKIASDLIILTAVDFMLKTDAAADEELVSFRSIGAQVRIGSLLIGGEGRNFAIMGDGSFVAKPGFGVFLTVGSASGDSFKWPSWLPVKINAIGLEWPDFNNDPGRFVITLSMSVESMPAVPGLEFSGSVEGLKIDPFLLLEGKFPIVDIASFGVTVEGNLFGGSLSAGLIGGILKLDANDNIIDVFDSTTPVEARILFLGIQGGFSLPGLGGLTIRLGLSELGPLGVFISASVPGGIVLEPNTGLAINDFSAGVEFFKSLPSIDDPFELRRPEFGLATEVTADLWLAQIKQQVVTQFKAIKANPALGGFGAAFTAPMVISGGAKIFTIYASKETFNGEVQIKISTDGKFLIVGKLNFAADNISLSAKLYADLSNVAQGSITILFLADIPDQIRLLTVHGKFKMGFQNAAGEDVEFDVFDGTQAAPVDQAPMFSLIDPAEGSIDANRLNAPDRLFNGKAYIDVEFRAPSGASLDFDSIFDTAQEFNLVVNGVAVSVNGVPVPIVTDFAADGTTSTSELVPNSGETLADAIRREGTTRFRYTIEESGFVFPRGVVEVQFEENGFKNLDVTLENGTTVAGVGNAAATFTIAVEGTTAALLDPGRSAGVDISELNRRRYIEVVFEPAVGSTLDEGSIFDASAEFSFSGAAADGVTLVSEAPEKIAENTFRFAFTGDFTLGQVSVDFLEDRWMDLDGNGNRAFSQVFTVQGATADLVNPPSGRSIGEGSLNANGFLIVRFQPTSGAVLDHATIDGDEVKLLDPDGNEVALNDSPQRLVIDANNNEVPIGEVTGDFVFTNRYVYRFDATLPLGRYTVEFLEGSFADQSGFANVAETENFLVQIPKASLVDPLPFDTFDREALNGRDYIDVAFDPVTGAGFTGFDVEDSDLRQGVIDSLDSILDSGQEFTLAGADGENIIVEGMPRIFIDDVEFTQDPGEVLSAFLGRGADAMAAGEDVFFRYDFAGQFDTGLLTVTFIAGAWIDPVGNPGSEIVQQIGIITEAQSFFMELSGGVILQAGEFLDEPLMEVKAEVVIELDFARSVFSLSLSGQLNLIKLGTVGATAGKFVLDTSGELSNLPQFWGVMTLETNFEEFEQFGIFLFAKGTLQINTTAFEKTETLTLAGLGENGGDLTRTFVLPAFSFLLEVLGQAKIRPPGADFDLARMEGGFLISINPNRVDIFVTAELSFGLGDSQITYGEVLGVVIIRTGLDGANPGVAGFLKVGSSADVGLPGVGDIFSASGEVTVMFNTTLQEQVFVIPESFQPLLEDDGISEITIFAAAPGIDGTQNPRAPPGGEIYFTATISVKLNILDAIILEGYIQISAAVSPDEGTARFSVVGAVTTELEFIGALSGTLNLTVFIGVKTGVVGRIQLAVATDPDSPINDLISVQGEFLLEINAVVNLDGDDILQPETIDTFLIDTATGKFLRNPDDSLQIGQVEIQPGVLFELSGKMVLVQTLTLEGRFRFVLAPDILEIEVEARMILEPLGQLEVAGGLRIDENGLVLAAELSLNVGFGEEIGLGFEASAILHVNTTGAQQTIAGLTVDPGIKIRIEGRVDFLSFASGAGFVEINISDAGFTLEFGVFFNIGTEVIGFQASGFAGVFVDDNPGLVLTLNTRPDAERPGGCEFRGVPHRGGGRTGDQYHRHCTDGRPGQGSPGELVPSASLRRSGGARGH